MGAFFEPHAPIPDPPEDQPAPWVGPPGGAFPGVVALELVLVRTPTVAIYASYLLGYPTGFAFDVIVVTNLGPDDELDLSAALFGHHHPRRGRRHEVLEALAPERLRLGVEFADGAKATNTAAIVRHRPDPPSGPVLQSRNGGTSGRTGHQEQWVWPLPPPGPVSFVCEWPAAGIALTRRGLDAQVILDAAGRAQTVFPGQPPAGGSVTGTTHPLT